MAVLQKRIKLVGSKGSQEVEAIFDGGSTYSCLPPKLAKKLEIIVPLPEPMDFGTAKKGEKLTATQSVRLNFYLNGYRFSDEFMIIPGLSEEAIIGAKTMQAWRFKLDYENDEVIIDPRVTKLRLLKIKINSTAETPSYATRASEGLQQRTQRMILARTQRNIYIVNDNTQRLKMEAEGENRKKD